MSECPYHAALEAAGGPAQAPTKPTRLAFWRERHDEDPEYDLFEQPVKERPGLLKRAAAHLGHRAAAFLNWERLDIRWGGHQLNPIRIGHHAVETLGAGVDRRVPREYFGVLGALSRGTWNTTWQAPRFAERYAANKARAVADRERGVPVDPYTPDGDTWAYTVPNMPLIRFEGPQAVDTGFHDLPGWLLPVYTVKGETALKRVLTHPDFDRGPVPHHLLSQVVGSSTIVADDEQQGAGLFAGRTQNNRTWKDDRLLGLRLVGPRAFDGLIEGMREAMHEIDAEIEAHIDERGEEPIDGTILMSRVAYRMIVRAAIGHVDDAEFQRLGQELTVPFRLVLGHLVTATNGYLTHRGEFVDALRQCKRVLGEISAIVRRMDAEGTLDADKRDAPLVQFVLHGHEGSDGPPDDDRLFTLLLPILFGGHETTGFTLAWALYHLAQDPLLERRYLAELRAFQADHPGQVVRPELYDERPLQQALMYEIGRRYPPIVAVPRMSKRAGVMPADPDTGIGAFTYPANALFLASIAATHLDPSVYPSPERFDVNRWLVGTEHLPRHEAGQLVRKAMHRAEKHFRYLLFGGGPGKCLGQAFNQLEFNLVLDHMLSRYHFELVDPDAPVRQSHSAISGPEAGAVAVRIRRRAA